jgi:hypothetical protein
MKRTLILAAALALATLPAAASIIVPGAGTGPGAGGSHWQSELTVHTAGPRPVTLSLTLHQGTTVLGPETLTLEARETISVNDVVRTLFGVEAGSGAIVIDGEERDLRTVAVTSRTSNVTATGEFGQDIPSVLSGDALRAGDIAALPAASTLEGTRFNFGLFATEAASVKWQVLRADGTVAATRQLSYVTGEHAQYNNGVFSFLGVEPQANDTVHARVESGRIFAFGSIVNATGDPTFVPGIRTRDDIEIIFLGVDLDENGTVDIGDSDHDRVLDSRITITRSLFPNYFRIVAAGEFGETVSLEIVSSPAFMQFLDSVGTAQVIANGGHWGDAEIVVRATSGDSSSLLTIPVTFR